LSMIGDGVAENPTVTVHVGLQGLFVKIAVMPVGRGDAVKVTSVEVAAPSTKVAVIDDEGLVPP